MKYLGARLLPILIVCFTLVLGAQALHYERSKYYTRANREPFTFVSVYKITAENLDHSIRLEVTQAEDSRGRRLFHERNFNPDSAKEPLTESADLVEAPNGKVVSLYWTKWQETLGKPMLATSGTNRQTVREHPLPENNCVAPEPALRFVHYEPVWIGGKSYPSAIVESHDDMTIMTAWDSMTPGLGCLELKSVATYTGPDKVKGTTVREPIFLNLAEPDPKLLDIADRISRSSVEMVPLKEMTATQ